MSSGYLECRASARRQTYFNTSKSEIPRAHVQRKGMWEKFDGSSSLCKIEKLDGRFMTECIVTTSVTKIITELDGFRIN